MLQSPLAQQASNPYARERRRLGDPGPPYPCSEIRRGCKYLHHMTMLEAFRASDWSLDKARAP